MPQLLRSLKRPLSIISLVAALTGCGTSTQRQYQSTAADSLMSDGCRGLAAVVEQREAFGIVAPSQKTDEAALLRCRLGYNDAGPSTEATPYQAAVAPPFDRVPPNRSTDEVTIERHGNTYTVPVRVNQTITLPFILDTGATDLVIPADVALTLIRAGALTSDDFSGKTRYSMANGSDQVSDLVIIREVQVGDHIVRNVTALVSPPAGDLLLGQSFLSKFGTVTLDYKRLVLVLSR
jgi:clan AA aspartic protease (TIGR02281 family)